MFRENSSLKAELDSLKSKLMISFGEDIFRGIKNLKQTVTNRTVSVDYFKATAVHFFLEELANQPGEVGIVGTEGGLEEEADLGEELDADQEEEEYAAGTGDDDDEGGAARWDEAVDNALKAADASYAEVVAKAFSVLAKAATESSFISAITDNPSVRSGRKKKLSVKAAENAEIGKKQKN